MNDVEKQNAKLNLGIHEILGYVTKELNGSFFVSVVGYKLRYKLGYSVKKR